MSNSAFSGGGVHGGRLENSVIVGNVATNLGGGVCDAEVYGCTISENHAGSEGGGVYGSFTEYVSVYIVHNSIIYYNTTSGTGANYEMKRAGDIHTTCTTPAPGSDPSNITDPPLFADRDGGDFRLLAGSPGIDTGSNLKAKGDSDRDGNPRIINGTVDMGAYEMTGTMVSAAIMLLPRVLTFSTPVGTDPSDQSIEIRNGGQGTLDYTLASDAGWLATDPDSGSSTGETDTLSVTIDVAGLAVGGYTGTLAVTSGQADNSPQTATVVLKVIEEGGTPDPPPAGPGTHYVNIANTTPQSPYTNWAMAALNIQDAADVAVEGATIWVADGVYDSGMRLPPYTDPGNGRDTELACRVVITNGITVRSLNGADQTHIVGAPAAGGGNGDGAVRCVYMATNATLVGFTIRDGHTRIQPGLLDEPAADLKGGGVFTDVRAPDEERMYNTGAVASNCVFTGNSSFTEGGGTWGVHCRNCLFFSNTSRLGGGAGHGSAINCTITDNAASGAGGGAYSVDLFNCVVYHNTGNGNPNWNISEVLGADRDTMYTCGGPGTLGSHNIAGPPRFVDRATGDYRLAPDSPCVGMGNNAYVDWDKDLDGGPRIYGGTVDMGVYEQGHVDYWLSVSTHAINPSVTEGNNPSDGSFTVRNLGDQAMNWHVASDTPWLAVGPAWGTSSGEADTVTVGYDADSLASGSYTGTITVASTQTPESMQEVTVILTINQGIYYVDVNNATPEAPYASWATAANTIQEAVDLAADGTKVLVADGVYQVGEKDFLGYPPANRVVMEKNVLVESVNGAAHTFIVGESDGGVCGANAVRCVLMLDGTLRGFTITNGYSAGVSTSDGGGVCGVYRPSQTPTLEDCVVEGNYTLGEGGGVHRATAKRCVIRNNSAGSSGGGLSYGNAHDSLIVDNSTAGDGGGAQYGMLYNCTVVGNRATNSAGGIYGTFPNNSIIYYNEASSAPNWLGVNTYMYHYSCTVPLLNQGSITNAPNFIDRRNGDYHLSYRSSCRDSGSNAKVESVVDLDGNTRIQNVTVDMGCYEFDPATAPYIPEAWWTGYGESSTNGVDGDLDGDGRSNYEEYIADTDPGDRDDFFPEAVLTEGAAESTMTIIIDPSSANREYSVQWKVDMTPGTPWQPYGASVPGNGGALRLTFFSDLPDCYYRATVRVP